MKKRWLVPLALVLIAGIAGFGLTREKAQEVQRINAKSDRVENIGSRTKSLNPLREEAYPGLSEIVRDYYASAGKENSFAESYDDIRVYTKVGQYTGSYVAFVRYDMKIKDIYTKVPGLGTLYIERDRTSGEYEIKSGPGGKELTEYVSFLSTHDDVRELLEETNTAYETAVDSDALLRESLLDLKKAYEEQT